MGSAVCTAGPFFIVGKPDYEAPKRLLEQELADAGFVNEDGGRWEFGDNLCYKIAEETWVYAEDFDRHDGVDAKLLDVMLDGGWDDRDYEDGFEAFERISAEIQHSYQDWARGDMWRTHLSGGFTGGGQWFMHAGEDYGSYGNEVADISRALESKWFRATGWNNESEYTLIDIEIKGE